jgi:hypothetical protein
MDTERKFCILAKVKLSQKVSVQSLTNTEDHSVTKIRMLRAQNLYFGLEV